MAQQRQGEIIGFGTAATQHEIGTRDRASLIFYRPILASPDDQIEMMRVEDLQVDAHRGGSFLKPEDLGHFGQRRVERAVKQDPAQHCRGSSHSARRSRRSCRLPAEHTLPTVLSLKVALGNRDGGHCPARAPDTGASRPRPHGACSAPAKRHGQKRRRGKTGSTARRPNAGECREGGKPTCVGRGSGACYGRLDALDPEPLKHAAFGRRDSCVRAHQRLRADTVAGADRADHLMMLAMRGFEMAVGADRIVPVERERGGRGERQMVVALERVADRRVAARVEQL
ncbi:hypothetical protein ABG067_008079, partial [Albugo candida]